MVNNANVIGGNNLPLKEIKGGRREPPLTLIHNTTEKLTKTIEHAASNSKAQIGSNLTNVNKANLLLATNKLSAMGAAPLNSNRKKLNKNSVNQ